MMYLNLLAFSFFVLSPVLTAVVKEQPDACRADEYTCASDGACVILDALCDGEQNCADGSDEAGCIGTGIQDNVPLRNTKITRTKRQASQCNKRTQWQCRDGTCISFFGKCDGTVDCPDGSDETFPLCRKMQCQSNWFRCTYGACVDGTATCNGQQECADNSDELLPRCRNQTDEVRGQFKCDDGQVISAPEHCDGVVNCADGSDETIKSCAAKPCPSYLFQCAYGACVDMGADCNGIQECADGSDESDELCNRISPGKPATTAKPTPVPQPSGGNCVLPAYPDHGHYEVGGLPNAVPGQSYAALQLNITCNRGYGVIGDSSMICYNGIWSTSSIPQCVRFCPLNPHPSVEYRCLVNGKVEGSRDCNPQEPSGTIVRPTCRAPNYYYPGVLNLMTCIDGSWDYTAICNPGLNQNGNNITILIKDQNQVEVFVSNFTYMVPLFDLPAKPSKENSNLPTFNFTLSNSKFPNSLTGVFSLTLPNIDISIPVTEKLSNNIISVPVTEKLPNNSISVPVTENPLDSDYDINEEDWRMGTPSKVNVNINNSSVIINAGNVLVRNGG